MTTVELRRVASTRVSNVNKHSVDGEIPVRLCNYTDVYYNPTVRDDQTFMAATATLDQVKSFALRDGDTVITKDSETAADIGIAAYVQQPSHDLICGYHLAILRPGPLLHPSFLTWSMRSGPVRESLASNATGMTRVGLTYDAINRSPIRLVSVGEQRRIADFLDDQVSRIDRIVDARRRQYAALDSARLANVQHWVHARRSAMVPLRRIVSRIINGSTPDRAADLLTGTPWYTPASIRRDGSLGPAIRHVDPREAGVAQFPGGSVLVVAIGATAGRVTWLDHAAAGNQQLTALAAKISTALPEFIYMQLDARRDELLAMSASTTLPLLTNAALRAFPIVLVPLKEQRTAVLRWSERAASVAGARAALERSIDLLTEYRRTIITAAIVGEFDVTTASRRSVPA